MWIIDKFENPHNQQMRITSKRFLIDKRKLRLTYYFYIVDTKGHKIAHGRSAIWMDPAPLWLAGLKLGGDTIWYMNAASFLYEQYIPIRQQSL